MNLKEAINYRHHGSNCKTACGLEDARLDVIEDLKKVTCPKCLEILGETKKEDPKPEESESIVVETESEETIVQQIVQGICDAINNGTESIKEGLTEKELEDCMSMVHEVGGRLKMFSEDQEAFIRNTLASSWFKQMYMC